MLTKGVPLSDEILPGIPDLGIICLIKDFATAAESCLEVGNAFTHLINLNKNQTVFLSFTRC